MKEKILIALRNKYKNLGLSEKVLETLANIVVAKTTDEANIETEVAGVDDIAKAFQSEADRVRSEAAQKAKADADKSKKDSEKKEEPEKKENTEVPEWAKSLIDSNKALADKLSAIEAGKTTQTRKTVLEAKLTGVSDTFKATVLKNFERMQFNSDEDFNTFITEFDTEIAAAQQEFSNASLQTGSHIPSLMTSKNKDGISKETETYIKSLEKADGSTAPQGKQVFQQPSS